MTRRAYALHPGDHIHVTPHDIYAGWPTPIRHYERDEPDVQITGIAERGRIVIICWCTTSTPTGVAVYDRDAPVEVVEVAA